MLIPYPESKSTSILQPKTLSFTYNSIMSCSSEEGCPVPMGEHTLGVRGSAQTSSGCRPEEVLKLKMQQEHRMAPIQCGVEQNEGLKQSWAEVGAVAVTYPQESA